jgi:hypothetical protein
MSSSPAPRKRARQEWLGAPAPSGKSFWSDEYNIWTGLFGTLFLFLSYFGCDQVQVQSLLSSKSVDSSRRALLMPP